MNKPITCVCLLWVLSLVACNRDAVQTPAPIPVLPTPKTVVEHRKTLTDSLTVSYAYDAQGQLLTETYRWYDIAYLYNPKNYPSVNEPGSHVYRVVYTNGQGQVINNQRLINNWGVWHPAQSDSSIYLNGRLIRRELRDYIFDADGNFSIGKPFWLTKRLVGYDQQGRVVSEQDSVFVTHDVPTGSYQFIFIAPKYVYGNLTTYQYNAHNEVILKTAVSEADKLKTLTHSDGEGITARSRPAFFQAGTTTYQYTYRSDGTVLRKTATLRPVEIPTEYVSTFDYSY